MKVLKKASLKVHQKEAENTMSERSILEAISHPFIVKLYYAFQSPSKLYLILSYAAGGELFNFLAIEKMFSDDVARFYISELLLALDHLHGLGIIYRDLKPENVMLDNVGHVKLTDFGLSKIAIDARSVCGTVEFMAPEILQERNSYDKAVDYWRFVLSFVLFLFSLGIMLYDMITGSPPFTGPNRRKIMERVLTKKPIFPKYMTVTTRDLCTKLLKKDPNFRIGSDKIKSHRFFNKLDWAKVLAKEYHPPHVPTFNSPTDLSNFSTEFTSIPIRDSIHEQRHLNVETSTDSLFQGFSFVAPDLL